ncbi:MAG: flagellar M-ring protein FliF [Rhodobacteraceae bacterium]|nr:flagellar M-ring protein FliF [Paracoccaceae bacterium]
MQNIQALWSALDNRKRMIVGGAALVTILAVLGIARMAATPGMALLYSGLEDATAGEVIQALESRGVRYSVRGDSIFVPGPQRDETRLMLAAAGLPANTHSGYELLDSLSGFGTTSQMFDAAYWRAKEGELARTIAASPHIRTARVHISQGVSSAFRRDVAPSASVTVTPVSGMLTPPQARAIRFLVASAIAGMAPEDVSVIDGAGGLVYGPESEATPHAAAADRSAELRRSVERLLEAHVGHGRAVVELSIETVTDREVIHERRVDPDSRVAISTESEENESSTQDTRSAGVTVASNLPDGEAAGADGNAQSRDSQTRQRMNYDMSETRREIERLPGAIRRISVAVLIDGVQETGAEGAPQWRPRSPEEMEALRELVASAVGYDAARGDVITLRSLPFEPVAVLGTAPPEGLFSGAGLDLMTVLKWLFALVFLIVLSVFVLRPMLRAALQANGSGPTRYLPDEAGFGPMEGQAALARVQPPALRGQSVESYAPPADAPDPVERLRNLLAERQQESVELLRHWIEDAPRPQNDRQPRP